MLVGSDRARRSSRLAWAGALVVLAALLVGCDTTPVVLSGTVTATPSGAGAGGVVVAVYADDAETLVASTTTDLDGGYELRSSTVVDGSYRLRVGDRWWPAAASWADAATIELSASSPATIDVSFDEVATVSGQVLDDHGSPLASIEAIILRADDGQVVAHGQTDANGDYRVPVIATGTYRALLVDPSGTWPWVYVGGDAPVDVLVLPGSSSTHLGVVDISTGLPYMRWPDLSRVSVGSDGSQAEAMPFTPSISADGRYVAFASFASNLVAGDTNDDADIFVHDRTTGTNSRASVASDGTESDNWSGDLAMSADGRYVAFESFASTLVPGDTNATMDVFVHDRTTGTTSRVSVASDGTEGDAGSDDPTISADGRYITFRSRAATLVAGDTNGTADVFVRDQATGTTTRVSVASDGTEGDGDAGSASISADGRFVAFSSSATNLVAGFPAGGLFVHDRTTGETTPVSVASDGTPANSGASQPAMSTDGRYVTFSSWASNLVAGDTNDTSDVFVHDRTTGTTTRVSVTSGGGQADDRSESPRISADGRYVTFTSVASNLVAGDTNGVVDVFVHDRTTGDTARVPLGYEADNEVALPSISASGRFVAFVSSASNLVVGDTNGTYDVFVYDREAIYEG